MKTHIIAAHFNPWGRWLWTERLPVKLPGGYTGGRRIRQYRMTVKRFGRLYDACIRAGFQWSSDNNGTHLHLPGFVTTS